MFGFKKILSSDRPLRWREDYEKNIEDYKEILNWGVFRNWGNIKNPFDIGREIRLALKILFARGDIGLSTGFAERVVAFVNRSFEEGLFERCVKEDSSVNVLLCESTARINLAHAKLILENKLDTALLMRAVQDLREGIKPEYSHSYNESIEYDLLTAVLICLVCGEREEAEKLYALVAKKNRQYNKCFYESIRAIIESPVDFPELQPLAEYIKQSSYPSFPNYYRDKMSITPVVHQFELGVLYAAFSGKVTANDFHVSVVASIVADDGVANEKESSA